ncbi:unnamed protein product [Dimorphilus gyrociliatus]|uniref:Uncharacterized protein n=1 Tax=Dimorphilus gyrociliatus TaxID=2664684 RepID=A0A7I8W3B6_9ANNE|nr:unnamed protein product [Dimorphilus gyrociliatus]
MPTAFIERNLDLNENKHGNMIIENEKSSIRSCPQRNDSEHDSHTEYLLEDEKIGGNCLGYKLTGCNAPVADLKIKTKIETTLIVILFGFITALVLSIIIIYLYSTYSLMMALAKTFYTMWKDSLNLNLQVVLDQLDLPFKIPEVH